MKIPPKERHSQAFPHGNEDCMRMALWRRPDIPGAEGESAECAKLSGKRTEHGFMARPSPP